MSAIIQTICRFVTSSVGRKIIVAITGSFLLLFLAGHLVGNLLIYGQPEMINAYAYGLHSMPEIALWGIRAGLGVVFLIHIIITVQLKYENFSARDEYKFQDTIKATLSSRYMIYTGATIAVFLIYHLLQYTLRCGYNPADYAYTFPATSTLAGAEHVFNVHKMIVDGFSNIWVSGFYIVAVVMLFSHLRHGVQSVFQSAGLSSRKLRPIYNLMAYGYAAVICLGFGSIPVAVLLGIIK